MEVAAQAAYDSAFTFIFSPRPGTRAAQMTELFVSPDEIADRFERLKVVIERSALARNHARVGRIEQTIVEGPSRKDAAVLSGRTRQGKLVHFAPPAGTNLAIGTFVGVRIEHGAPHHLVGTLVSVESDKAPRLRQKIPVAAV